MRYDDRVDARSKWARRKGSLWPLLSLLVLLGCKSGPFITSVPDTTSTLGGTSDPYIAETLRADAQLTAAWVVTQPQSPTATDEPFLTVETTSIEGVSPAEQTGQCPIPGGYILHVRQGFCLSAPLSWTALNVDGGSAAFLNTTPGQTISLRPDWAGSPKACSLLIYIATEASPAAHLEKRYSEFVTRSDLEMLSRVQMQLLGEMALPGFTWSLPDGETGGIYAASLSSNRLVHISHSGSLCPLEDLLPVIDTLRFNIE